MDKFERWNTHLSISVEVPLFGCGSATLCTPTVMAWEKIH